LRHRLDKQWPQAGKDQRERLAGKAEQLDFIINLETYLAVMEDQATIAENEEKEGL